MNRIFLNLVKSARHTCWTTLFTVSIIVGNNQVRAEPVPDSTADTNVTQKGDRFDINGGITAGDNLFHSFAKFGLDRDQIANFMSNPKIRNILGRVTGGDASIINGLIRVTGGDSNLFLINPAGIILGKDATLDLPASFTATTADGLQIGEFWFDALGSNNYSNLVGEPNGFAFVTDTPGSIVNGGNLSVASGETINLVGGLVINTGTLEAPEGKINIIAVPEKQLVKISPEGSLLSLGLPTSVENSLSSAASITPQALPELLTGRDLQQATGVEVADNGTIKLIKNDTEIPSDFGTAIASGNLNVSGNRGGEINILGDRVGVVAGNIAAAGINDGGEILIGGDYKGRGEVPNASRTLIDRDSTITADAVENGDGGRVIAWADEVTAFYGNISATGGSNSGDGGFVEVSGKDGLVFEGEVDLTAVNGTEGMLLLDPRRIRIVKSGGNTQENELNIDGEFDVNNSQIDVLNTSELPEEPEDGFTISIDTIANKNVRLEATESIIFERDTLVDTNGDNPEFIGALIDPDNVGDNEAPAQDVPQFNNLALLVEPPEGQTGSISINGSFAVREKLEIKNTNGDINVDLQLPETIDLKNTPNFIDTDNERGSIFVGIDSLLTGVSPNGESRQGVGTAEITAPQGSVKLQGGITLNADSDLTIEAQNFTATDPVTLQGNGATGQPGRDSNRDLNDLAGENFTYNIGVAYFGGSLPNNDNPEFDAGKLIVENSDPAPNVQLQVLFDPDNQQVQQPEPLLLPGDEGTLATAEITIILLEDESFSFGEFSQSGIQTDIQRFARIETDGSIGGGSSSLDSGSFTLGLIEPPDNDNQLAEQDSETELVAITDNDAVTDNEIEETTTAICSDELDITSLPGSNEVKATCGEQALAFVFTQPKDEAGNPIKITDDLFPELLTGDEFINLEGNTSWHFWQAIRLNPKVGNSN